MGRPAAVQLPTPLGRPMWVSPARRGSPELDWDGAEQAVQAVQAVQGGRAASAAVWPPAGLHGLLRSVPISDPGT